MIQNGKLYTWHIKNPLFLVYIFLPTLIKDIGHNFTKLIFIVHVIG